jgi:hypothetical protein
MAYFERWFERVRLDVKRGIRELKGWFRLLIFTVKPMSQTAAIIYLQILFVHNEIKTAEHKVTQLTSVIIYNHK